MAQPVVIQRLEEAVDALTSFEGETKTAREPLDELAAGTSELTEAVGSEGEKTIEAIEEAQSSLSELRSRLEEAGQEARDQLEEVTGRSSELAGEAGQALEKVKELLAALDAARESMLAAVGEGVQLTQTECQQVSSQVEALQGELNQGLETAFEGIQTFRTAVGEARTRLTASRNHWEEVLSALESAAHEQTAMTQGRLHDLFTRLTASFVAAKNEVITQHNQSMSQMWDNLAEELPQELEPLFESLAETLATLDELRAAHVASIESSCANVESLARDLAGLFGNISSDLGQSAGRLPRG